MLLTTSVVGGAFGQNLESDLQKISESMESAKSVAINVQVSSYSSKGGSLIYSAEASAMKMDRSMKNVLAEIETISTPYYELKIDHEERAILILEKDSTESIQEINLSDFDVRKLKKYFENDQSEYSKTVKLVSNSNGKKTYSITGIEGMREVLISLDANSNKIIQITYEYGSNSQKGQYTVLDYTKFVYNKDLSASFDLNTYFSEVNGQYVLVDKLKGYQIFTEK